MLEAYLAAFVITAGIIIGLGPQNIFIIKQGIRGKHVLVTVLICELCEVLTISLGAIGAGYVFSQNILLQKIIGIGGVLFLLFYGYKSFRSAYQSHADIELHREQIPLKEIILASLSISLLNPWALMDTMVIIGGGAAQYESLQLMVVFVFGSLTASTLWFCAIGFGSKKFQHILNTDKANKILDLIAGVIMWLAAFYLMKTMVLG